MDPLSVTASVVAVLQATQAVISACCDYRLSVKGSSWELPRVLEEIRDLQNVLQMLKELADKAEGLGSTDRSRLPALKSLCNPDTGVLQKCCAELEKLQEKLAPPVWSGPEGSKRRSLVQALSWPLKKGETEKVLENIERFKSRISVAMAVDQATSNLAIAVNTQSIEASLSSVKLDVHQGEIRRWLRATDPSAKYNNALQDRKAGTGSWLIKNPVFSKWLCDQNSLIWLYGIAGCGKTVLCSTAIESVLHQRNTNPAGVAYFYFEFTDQGKQHCDAMLRSLISQLSSQIHDGAPILDDMYVACGSGASQPTPFMLMKRFQELVKGSANVFIFLDALDECEDKDELMTNIEEIAGWGYASLHMLVTSRQEKQIEDVFSGLPCTVHRVCVQSAPVEDDIRAYVRSRIQKDPKLRKWRKPEVQTEIEMALVEKAGGMFQWVKCQLDALEQCLSLFDLRKALRSLPKDLDNTYARILHRIDDDGYGEDAAKVMKWLAYSTRPMTLEEIAETLTVDKYGDPRIDVDRRLEDPRDLLKICSSLVTTVRQKLRRGIWSVGDFEDAETLQFAHFSVREYLGSSRLEDALANFFIHEKRTNSFLAETCLIYNLDLTMPRNGLPNLNLYDINKIYPLAKYAALTWNHHAEKAVEDGDIDVYREVLFMYTGLELAKSANICTWDLSELVDAQGNLLPLLLASRFDRPYTISRLISNGIDIRSLLKLDDFKALMGVLYQDRDLVEVVKVLLDNGAQTDTRNHEGASALLFAALQGHVKMTQLLLDRGADINAPSHSGQTALTSASLRGHTRTLQLLLDRGASISYPFGVLALNLATRDGHLEVVQILLEHGVDVDAENVLFPNVVPPSPSRWLFKTALLESLRHDSHDIAELLVKYGADVNAQSLTVIGKRGFAIEHALDINNHKMVQFLLEHGADPSLIRIENLSEDGVRCYESCSLKMEGEVQSLRVQEEAEEPRTHS